MRRSKEEIMQALKNCIPDRSLGISPNGPSCMACLYGDKGTITLTCVDLLKDIYQYLEESDAQ